MKSTIATLITTAAVVAVSGAASADSVTYEMAASGVTCAGSAAHAENAVRAAGEVQAVKADPVSHSVTTTFDDEQVSLASIVESLEEAGMTVGEPVKIQ